MVLGTDLVQCNKLLQDALDQSEESFQLLVNSVQDHAIFTLDPEGHVVSWNCGAQRLKGYQTEAILGNHFSCFYTPEEIQADRPAWGLQVAASLGRFEEEGWRIRQDGSRFWANVAITALRDRQGNVRGFANVIRDLTERKSLEKLQASWNLFNTVIEGISDAVFVKDLQGHYLLINTAGARLLGRSVSEVTGRDDTELFSPESAQRIQAGDREVLVRGQTQTYEETLTAANMTHTYTSTKSPYRDENGNIIGLLGVCRDISDRKQAEAERSELLAREQAARLEADRSLALLDSFLANAPVGLAFFDPQLRCIKINPYLADLNGVPIEATIGRSLREYLPEYADLFEPLMQQVLDTGESILNLEITAETRAPVGQQYVLENFYPVYSQDHQILGTGIIITSITSLKQTQILLEERTAKLKLLSEITTALLSSQQPLDLISSLFEKLKVQMDLDVYFNFLVDPQKQMLHLKSCSGVSEELTQALEWLEFGQGVCGTVAQQGCQVVEENISQSTSARTEFLRAINVQAFCGQPLRVNGRVRGTLGFGSCSRSSFTPEEIELMQAVSTQLSIAVERAELIASLQEQTEQLQTANRMKDEFLAVISHELRSPLNAILGWATMLRGDRVNESIKARAIETIERNAKLQTQLIEDLLDVSRIITGKLRLELRPVKLTHVIEAAIDTVRPTANTKKIQIQTLLDPTAGTVKGDSSRLQQIFWNLVANAIKFTPDRGRIEVRLEQVENYAQITVTDTGQGISPDFLPYVFERFRQADGTTTRSHGGLGLGLAIVRHLVEMHGGTVTVDSAGEDQGSTFTVKLPLHTQRNHTLGQWGDGENHLALPPIPLQGVRVLVVDDEADTRDFMTVVLATEGACVQAVASAHEALEVMQQWQPDVLLSDIGMPEEDGYALIHQVRSRPPKQGGKIPAAALTAYAKDEERNQALEAGFQRHMSKPIEPTELIALVASLAGRNPSP